MTGQYQLPLSAPLTWGSDPHLILKMKCNLILEKTVLSNSFCGSSLNHCDIHSSYTEQPYVHIPHHPPTHSIGTIISQVAGSNKAVTQGKCLDLHKMRSDRNIAIITSQSKLSVYLSKPPAEVLQCKKAGYLTSRVEEKRLHTLVCE